MERMGTPIKFETALPILASAATVCVACVIARLWYVSIGPPHTVLIVLASIAVSGYIWGTRAAVVSAILGFVIYSLFVVEPLLAINFSPPGLLALGAFLGTAVFVGVLNGVASDRLRVANDQLRALNGIFRVTKDLASADSQDTIFQAVLRQLAHSGTESCALLLHGQSSGSHVFRQVGFSSGQAVLLEKAMLQNDSPRSRDWTFPDAMGIKFGLATAVAENGLTLKIATPKDRRESQRNHELVSSTLAQLALAAVIRTQFSEQASRTALEVEKERLRGALLSSVTHDLRTPLTSILAAASTISKKNGHISMTLIEEMAGIIEKQANRLDRYLSHLLALSRLDAGALNAQTVAMDIAEIIGEAITSHSGERITGRIVSNISQNDMFVQGDSILLKQALVNLIDNSFAHGGPDTTVTVGSSQKGDNITIYVEDDGFGIDPTIAARIFDRHFTTANHFRPHSQEGIGLGLSVVKGFIEVMGGKIQLVPTATGSGARFELVFSKHVATNVSGDRV